MDRQVRLICESYNKLLGRRLLDEQGEHLSLSQQLDQSAIIVLSHGTEADPILNYGNQAALALWEMGWSEFTRMPSRQTAEPMIQEERDRFMQQVAEQGYVEGYTGIRISASGRRFRIMDAVVWNLTDEQGAYCGQAAAFEQWEDVE
ncbi:MEKHLA domain-containing protein [Paenibacillus sp. GCM10023252]|uniref:MEKHLA domain-containing protein n=1 Tax=Paenibacillus sp. GCM10023252 TaxID=3252649 RepID=UPI003621B3D1